MQQFKLKKGDSKPVISATLTYANGSPVDLTNGSVFFQMGNIQTYAPVYSGAAVITDAPNGVCEYRWSGTDTGSTGTFWADFRVTWGTGSVLTLPNDHSFQVIIAEDYR